MRVWENTDETQRVWLHKETGELYVGFDSSYLVNELTRSIWIEAIESDFEDLGEL